MLSHAKTVCSNPQQSGEVEISAYSELLGTNITLLHEKIYQAEQVWIEVLIFDPEQNIIAIFQPLLVMFIYKAVMYSLID